MPTFYTAIIDDKPDVTFNEFVLRCARGMGTFLHQRDDRSDAPNRLQKLSPIYSEEVVEAEKELVAVLSLSEEAVKFEAEKEYLDAMANYHKRLSEHFAGLQRLGIMLNRVRLWEPPTDEHEGLKRFMIEQLETDMKNRSDLEKYLTEPPRLSGSEWLSKKKSDLIFNLNHAQDSYREQVERIESANRWIQVLYDALGEKIDGIA